MRPTLTLLQFYLCRECYRRKKRFNFSWDLELTLWRESDRPAGACYEIITIVNDTVKFPPGEFWVEVTSMEDVSIKMTNTFKKQGHTHNKKGQLTCKQLEGLNKYSIYPGGWEKASAELVVARVTVSARIWKEALSLTMLSKTVRDWRGVWIWKLESLVRHCL